MKYFLLMWLTVSIVPAWSIEVCSILLTLNLESARPGSAYDDLNEGFSYVLRDTEGVVLQPDENYRYTHGPDFELHPGSAKSRIGKRIDGLSDLQLQRSLFCFDLAPGAYNVELYPNGWMMPLATKHCDVRADQEVCVIKVPNLRGQHFRLSPKFIKFFEDQRQFSWNAIFLPKRTDKGMISLTGPTAVSHNLRFAVLEDTGVVEVWLVLRTPTDTNKGAGVKLDDIDLAGIKDHKRPIILNTPSNFLGEGSIKILPPRITKALGD